MSVYLCSILLIKISLQWRPQETLFSCTAQGRGWGVLLGILGGAVPPAEEKNVAAQPHPPTNQVQTCIFQIPSGEALK